MEVASLHPQRADWPGVATTVLSESERLDELVADLLALAKLDETGNGAALGGVQPVDLDDLVLTDVARLRALGHMVRADGVSAARVEGDPGQLARLVRNLLDNAARHAASVVIVTLSEDGGQAVLRVDDDGPGIAGSRTVSASSSASRAVDEGRARRQGGAGLGLVAGQGDRAWPTAARSRPRRAGRRRPLRGPPAPRGHRLSAPEFQAPNAL